MRKASFALLVLALLVAGCSQKLPVGMEDTQLDSKTIAEQQQRESTLEQGSRLFEEKSGEASIESDSKKILITARQFSYEPDIIEAEYGETVMLTITSIDVGHGFALPDFGINTRVPPEESVTVTFVADKKGEFNFFNPVYSGSGWKNMTGKLIVK
jgi:cytochrome c oxidase subunit 2